METKDKTQEEIELIALLLTLHTIGSRLVGGDSTHSDSDSNSK